uniref:Uncharacterized protein n=1 Tax=Globodera rostochiensis TaxID=31243 RepID=A0A914GWT5_GLORO
MPSSKIIAPPPRRGAVQAPSQSLNWSPTHPKHPWTDACTLTRLLLDEKVEEWTKTKLEEHQKNIGSKRASGASSPFPLPQFNPPGGGVNVQNSPSLSTLRAGRPMLLRKKTFGGVSHSSRTISMDFDSETSGTTDDADRMDFVFPFIPSTPITQFPLTSSTPITQFPLISSTPITQFPLTSSTPITQFPLISSTPITQFPLISSTPITQFPLISSTPITQFPLISSTPITQFPLISSTPITQFPLTSSTPITQFPLISSTPITQFPLTSSTPITQFPLISSTPTTQFPFISSTPITQFPFISSTPITQFPLTSSTPITQFPLISSTPITQFPLTSSTPITQFPLISSTPITQFPLTSSTPITQFPLISSTPITQFPLISSTPITQFPLISSTPITQFPLISSTPITQFPLISSTPITQFPLTSSTPITQFPLISSTPITQFPLISSTPITQFPLISSTPITQFPLISSTPITHFLSSHPQIASKFCHLLPTSIPSNHPIEFRMIGPPFSNVVHSSRQQQNGNHFLGEEESCPEGTMPTGKSQMNGEGGETNGTTEKGQVRVAGGSNGNSSISREPSLTFPTHQKCNGKADHMTINNAHRPEQKHQNHPPMESPNIAARQQLHPCQQTQFNGAQFDTQSLRSRSHSISHPNNTLPPNASHQQHHQHRQHSSSGGFRYGSCTNLSALNGSGGGAGPLVLYDGGVGIDAECPPTAPQRHSMALIEAQMPSPYWYHQPQPMLHPPPPPFYYTAATLPHPPPMDLATFRRALKESERMEKERKVLVGERGLCAACWEFCCGGSALILWLVITLIALGFLGFLLLAIYFL